MASTPSNDIDVGDHEPPASHSLFEGLSIAERSPSDGQGTPKATNVKARVEPAPMLLGGGGQAVAVAAPPLTASSSSMSPSPTKMRATSDTTITSTTPPATASIVSTSVPNSPTTKPPPPPLPTGSPAIRVTSAPITDRFLSRLATTTSTTTASPAASPTRNMSPRSTDNNHQVITQPSPSAVATAKVTGNVSNALAANSTTTTVTAAATTIPPPPPLSASSSSLKNPPMTATAKSNAAEATNASAKVESSGGPPAPTTTPPPTATATATATATLRIPPPPPPPPEAPLPRGMGIIHPDTPIPNTDAAFRLLRKFASKTRPKIPQAYGGTKPTSILGYLMQVGSGSKSGQKDPVFTPYAHLMSVLYTGDETRDSDSSSSTTTTTDVDDTDRTVERIMGHAGDSMAKVRVAIASFCHLFSVIGHASSQAAEVEKRSDRLLLLNELLATSMDTAQALVAHGCLDDVLIGRPLPTVSRGDDRSSSGLPAIAEYQPAACVLAESIFNANMSMEPIELAAMKFLLTTGCHVTGENGHALLRGSHLLQAIRVLYHVYLTTTSDANRTTARAALQQLVTGVFVRMSRTETTHHPASADAATTGATRAGGASTVFSSKWTRDGFPSENHRDAFLVLRSLCKLSMRSLPDPKMHSHVGLQSSGSTVLWDAKSKDGPGNNNTSSHNNNAVIPPPPPSVAASPSVSTPKGTNGGHGRDPLSPPRTPRTPQHDDDEDYEDYDDHHHHNAPQQQPPTAPRAEGTTSETTGTQERPQLLYTSAIHPALESKILALELLTYVFKHTDMSGKFVQRCGPQFHYAVRNYLCVSLLKNCTSDNTYVVNLSLRLFVPLIHNFRSHLKTEIEAFVTNVFFVILDSKNSPAEHKHLVVTLFEEICSDPTTLAEIFLNYDCDLSAVDLFHRIVNTLSRVSRTGMDDAAKPSSMSFVAGAGAARLEKQRGEHRELRLEAMKALRQVLGSLHGSIVEPMNQKQSPQQQQAQMPSIPLAVSTGEEASAPAPPVAAAVSPSPDSVKQNLVQIYDSKKKRRQEESEVVLRFNQKPVAGIAYAAKCGHLDGDDPTDVARWLLKNKDLLDKTQIGEYLGREAEYQNGFCLKVLHSYVHLMDFAGLMFDDAIRFYLSGFRLPGEAQKIDRIMEIFAERYTEQNPKVFPTADTAFILAFSIIMLNTDLHNPAIKEDRRMTKEGFIRNNRGICDGQDLPEELLCAIFDRIKVDPISLKEDDEARERTSDSKVKEKAGVPAALSPAVFFSNHFEEIDRTRESNFQKERDQIVRTTELLLKRKRPKGEGSGGKSNRRASRSRSVKFVRTEDSGLRDEYVSPMFEAAWGPALAAFSTAMESANGTVGALIAIASDEELELAAENAAETIEVCLQGFRLAICTAGLCGNETARDAYMLALSSFSQLGSGVFLEARHIRCVQTMLNLARDDGELLGAGWEHVFKALSEVNRFHQLFHLMARNDRVAAAAEERRRSNLEERQRRKEAKESRISAASSDDGDSVEDDRSVAMSDTSDSMVESELFSDDDFYLLDDEMDKRAIDEANARSIYEAVSESLIEAIYERSSTLSGPSIKEFILQLCRVSRMEISGYGGHVGSQANTVDLTQVHYRQHHTLLNNSTHGPTDKLHRNQPNIYNLQKLVEVTHYNMESRPRLVFAEIWTTVSAHLTSTALHSNAAVAMYAVDSFRQLSIHCLQREELGVFEFQRRFLKPFEVIMAKAEHVTTKELLLKCVDRIILMFGSSFGDEATEASTPENGHSSEVRTGTLRSGWRPVLAVLGLAGQDEDEGIARAGFKMLTGQLKQCLSVEKGEEGVNRPKASFLLGERFVDLIDALLKYISGPHEELSLASIDHLVTLSSFLADKSFALELLKRRTSSTPQVSPLVGDDGSDNLDLELWWPILLGLSRSIEDQRKSVRLKSLVTLFGIINQHFFPGETDAAKSAGPVTSTEDLQTLQLIFRGILTPVLEFAEISVGRGASPPLPEDFDRFPETPKQNKTRQTDGRGESSSWLDSTFDHFMDGCVSLCLHSIETFKSDTLIEEVFAMLNNCLLSESGSLAVRGIRRLEQFVTSDLNPTMITDDTWATSSHMLRRCLFVRGLPRLSSSDKLDAMPSPEQEKDEDFEESVMEFVREDSFLSDRRYVGSNATMVIGSLLLSDRFSSALGLRWRLFLITSLARAIREWERAEGILATQTNPNSFDPFVPRYLETAMYGRKWMNRFILHLASMKDLMITSSTSDSSADATIRTATAHAVVRDQTQSLISAFLHLEASINTDKPHPVDTALFARLTALVTDLLSGYEKLDDETLRHLTWLSPALSSCIQSSNQSIRMVVQRLVQRTYQSTAAPPPMSPQPSHPSSPPVETV